MEYLGATNSHSFSCILLVEYYELQELKYSKLLAMIICLLNSRLPALPKLQAFLAQSVIRGWAWELGFLWWRMGHNYGCVREDPG